MTENQPCEDGVALVGETAAVLRGDGHAVGDGSRQHHGQHILQQNEAAEGQEGKPRGCRVRGDLVERDVKEALSLQQRVAGVHGVAAEELDAQPEVVEHGVAEDHQAQRAGPPAELVAAIPLVLVLRKHAHTVIARRGSRLVDGAGLLGGRAARRGANGRGRGGFITAKRRVSSRERLAGSLAGEHSVEW